MLPELACKISALESEVRSQRRSIRSLMAMKADQLQESAQVEDYGNWKRSQDKSFRAEDHIPFDDDVEIDSFFSGSNEDRDAKEKDLMYCLHVRTSHVQKACTFLQVFFGELLTETYMITHHWGKPK